MPVTRSMGDSRYRKQRLVGDHQPAGLEHRLHHGVLVPGQDAAQVDHLTGDALLLGQLHGAVDHLHLRAPAEHGDVATLLGHFGLADGQLVILLGHLAYRGTVETLGLEEDHRVRVANGRKQQPLGLVGIARHHDLEAGRMGEIGFR